MKLQAGNYMRSEDAVYFCIDETTIYLKGKIVLGVSMGGVFYRLNVEDEDKKGVWFRWVNGAAKHSRAKKVIRHNRKEIERLCRAALLASASRYIDTQFEEGE